MALSRAHVAGFPAKSATGYGTGTYTPATFTPASGELVVIIVTVERQSGTGDPQASITCTADKFTTTNRITAGSATVTESGIAIFTGVGDGTVTTLTIDCGAVNVQIYSVDVYTYSGFDTSTPVGATAASASDGPNNGAYALTLGGTPASDSEVIACLRDKNSGNHPTIAPGASTGYGELSEDFQAFVMTVEVESRTGSTATDVTWDDVNETAFAVIYSIGAAVEIKAAAAGGSAISAAGQSTAAITGASLVSTTLTAAGESTAAFAGSSVAGDVAGAIIATGESLALFGGASTVGANLLAAGESEAEFVSPEEDAIDVTLWGRLRTDARLRARIEAEDAELIRIVRTTIAPELLRRRTLH